MATLLPSAGVAWSRERRHVLAISYLEKSVTDLAKERAGSTQEDQT